MLSVLSFVVTVVVYQACRKLYARCRFDILNPILTSLVVMLIVLCVTRIPYATYMGGAHLLTDMLSPATVAFAVPLYKNFHLLKKHATEILISLMSGSIVAVVTSFLFARWLDLNSSISDSLAPRSVTTPIAMQVSSHIGGIPVLTAVFVIITAAIGIVVGPLSIRWFRIRSSVAKGTLLGMGAHGIGTSKAFEFGQIEGTFASLSMIIAAGFTVVLAPLLIKTLV